MEFEENKDEEIEHKHTEEDYVDIYSKKAIFWFSVFSPLYAGVLLMINLWAAGYKRAISQVVLFLLFFAIVSDVVIRLLKLNTKADPEVLKKFLSGPPPTSLKPLLPFFELSGLSLAFSIGAGLVLTQYFFKKYFPDNDYYPKSISRPLIIFILLALLLGSIGL